MITAKNKTATMTMITFVQRDLAVDSVSPPVPEFSLP
jgi:hypothetical protein